MLGLFQRLTSSRDDAVVVGTGEYADMDAGQVPAYQRYFIEIVNSISVDNLSKKLRGLSYDPKQDSRDQQLMRHICERALAENRVRSDVLVPLLEQFVVAKPSVRARNKQKWVSRVVSGKISGQPIPAGHMGVAPEHASSGS